MPSEAHESIVNLLRESGGIGLGPDGSLDVAAMREGMEAMTATAELPEGTRCTPCEVARRPAEWVEGPDADASRVLLYFHGGGYVIGSIATHRGLVARIARVAGIRGLVLDYRLAPEHPWPAGPDDGVAVAAWLIEHAEADMQEWPRSWGSRAWTIAWTRRMPGTPRAGDTPSSEGNHQAGVPPGFPPRGYSIASGTSASAGGVKPSRREHHG